MQKQASGLGQPAERHSPAVALAPRCGKHRHKSERVPGGGDSLTSTAQLLSSPSFTARFHQTHLRGGVQGRRHWWAGQPQRHSNSVQGSEQQACMCQWSAASSMERAVCPGCVARGRFRAESRLHLKHTRRFWNKCQGHTHQASLASLRCRLAVEHVPILALALGHRCTELTSALNHQRSAAPHCLTSPAALQLTP